MDTLFFYTLHLGNDILYPSNEFENISTIQVGSLYKKSVNLTPWPYIKILVLTDSKLDRQVIKVASALPWAPEFIIIVIFQ